MEIFDWRAKSTAQGIGLGLILSIFWAAQHPLQGPLYKALGQDLHGLLEAMMYAELVVVPLYLLLLLVPSVRRGVRAVLTGGRTPHLLVPPVIGIAGLGLYALAQTQVESAQVSIILTASPAAMLLYIYLQHKDGPRAAIKDAASSKVVRGHLFLMGVVGALAWAGAGYASFPTNWPFAAILLLVPGWRHGWCGDRPA